MRWFVVILTLAMLTLATPPARALTAEQFTKAFKSYQAHNDAGRYNEAEPFAATALKFATKVYGETHKKVAVFVNILAFLYQAQGRYAAAEPLFKRSLAIYEKALGPEHPDTATGLNNLAELYRAQGRYTAAKPLHTRALAVLEKTLGPEHPRTARSLNNLALLYKTQGRYAEAEPLYKRALAIVEKTLGPGHPHTATGLNNLAELYRAQGRYTAAKPLYTRALAVLEKVLGLEHPHTATGLNNLAGLYYDQGRYAEAEPLLKSSLAILEKTLGPEHPSTAFSLNNLALLFGGQGRFADAYTYSRRGISILRHRFEVASDDGSLGRTSEQKSARFTFLFHVGLSLKDGNGISRSAGEAEAFEVVQLAQSSEAAEAVSRMAARFAVGDDALARVVRQQQDGRDRVAALDKALIKALGAAPAARNKDKEAGLRDELTSLNASLLTLNEQIASEFPGFGELTTPSPLPIEQVQTLLGPHEALVLVSRAYAKDKSHVFVLRNGGHKVYIVGIGAAAVKKAVTELRRGIDLSEVQSVGDLPAFNTSVAYKLYRDLLGPAEESLAGAEHVFFVVDGALGALPIGVLVTEEPKAGVPYKDVAWLAKRYAATTLPSVSSLRALRTFTKRGKANQPFIGFGDPDLGEPGGADRGKINYAHLMRGFVANPDTLKQSFSSLPETADELRGIASALGASNDNIYLSTKATETMVKTTRLDPYRIVAFATHGLMAGEQAGLPEPALVLTPPANATAADDGLLTASEIAQLKLNAEWVILSACNTASGDTLNAGGLSGLAKAFFYAGSRALLVSHWPVESQATVTLITRMFETLANDNTIGRSEALRRSMLGLMNDTNNAHYAHPAFWAPFVVVGEGGSG